MKKLIIIGILIILAISAGYAQTIIPPTTTVDTFGNLKAGLYRFISKSDTIEIALDFQVHDTIPRICPKCPPPVVIPKVDTAAIQALKVCPPPIICPVCPPTKQRTAVSITEISTATKKTITILFDDGSTQIL